MKANKLLGGILVGAGGGLIAWEVVDFFIQRGKPKSMTPALQATKKSFVLAMQGGLPSESSAGISLLIAWAAYETDWGRTSGWTKGNNAFNITAGSTWKGDTVPGPDTEYDAAGNVKNITQLWRKYPNVKASIDDMHSFISQSRFGSANTKLALGDPTFTNDLYAGKYFTLPPDKYLAGVQATLKDLQGLGLT